MNIMSSLEKAYSWMELILVEILPLVRLSIAAAMWAVDGHLQPVCA